MSIRKRAAGALQRLFYPIDHSAVSFPQSFSAKGNSTPPTMLPREITTRYKRLFPGMANSTPDTAQ